MPARTTSSAKGSPEASSLRESGGDDQVDRIKGKRCQRRRPSVEVRERWLRQHPRSPLGLEAEVGEVEPESSPPVVQQGEGVGRGVERMGGHVLEHRLGHLGGKQTPQGPLQPLPHQVARRAGCGFFGRTRPMRDQNSSTTSRLKYRLGTERSRSPAALSSARSSEAEPCWRNAAFSRARAAFWVRRFAIAPPLEIARRPLGGSLSILPRRLGVNQHLKSGSTVGCPGGRSPGVRKPARKKRPITSGVSAGGIET